MSIAVKKFKEARARYKADPSEANKVAFEAAEEVLMAEQDEEEVEEKPKRRVVTSESMNHTALDKAEKALTIAKRVESRQAGSTAAPVAPADGKPVKKSFSQELDTFFGEMDQEEPDAEDETEAATAR